MSFKIVSDIQSRYVAIRLTHVTRPTLDEKLHPWSPTVTCQSTWMHNRVTIHTHDQQITFLYSENQIFTNWVKHTNKREEAESSLKTNKTFVEDDQVPVSWHGGLRCCRRALPTYAGLSVGARLIPAHYPGPSQLSGTESPGATAPAAREIQMFPVKSDGKSYKTLICSKRGIK